MYIVYIIKVSMNNVTNRQPYLPASIQDLFLSETSKIMVSHAYKGNIGIGRTARMPRLALFRIPIVAFERSMPQ